MRSSFLSRGLALALALPLFVACGDDDPTVPPSTRVYSQIERLGNPLVSEVFFMKRDHGLHNTTEPSTDIANGFRTKIAAFTNAFNRGTTIANTLGAVLVPDVLLVFPNRDGATAGWLSWALASGYGGRRLNDDVVDAGLTAIFGRLLDPTQTALAGLTSDNVAMSNRTFGTTFPYLEAAR
jgi:hypothetical protein